MRRTLLLSCCLALVACWPVVTTANDEALSEEPIPAEYQAAVTQAEFLGRQLYLHDRAAWLATDAMLADKRMRKLKKLVRGWLTEPSAHGIRVIFIGEGDTPRRIYEIEVDEGERLSEDAVESAVPLTAEQLSQLRARRLALSQPFMACAQQYNATVMPSATGLRVYLMPAFSQQSVYPLGGYHLYEIDSSGEKILSSRKFTNGCIEHNDSPTGLPKGARSVFGAFSHLLDPQPTEIHVFVSLYSKVPLVIMAIDSKTTWWLHQGHIRYESKRD